jgi:hypothetical protein
VLDTLAGDLQGIWSAPTTDVRLKKRIVRGGFTWSSQHLDGGVRDGHAETAFGSVGARRVALARPARGGAA